MSICIRGWRRDYAREAIASVLAQSYRNIEIVVSDDSGELDTIVRGFAADRIRYYRNERPLGPQANLVAALDRATGDLIGMLDDDDWLYPTYVEQVVDRFTADSSLGVTFTNHFIAEGDRLRRRRCSLRAGRYDSFGRELLTHTPISVSAALMRREVWQTFAHQEPPPDSLLIWFHAAANGWAFHYLDRPLVVYRAHPRQHSRDEAQMRDREVSLWTSLRFADSECDRLRRHRLSAALVSRSLSRLKQGQVNGASKDLALARAVAPERQGRRAWAARWLARHPGLIGPALRGRQAGRRLIRKRA